MFLDVPTLIQSFAKPKSRNSLKKCIKSTKLSVSFEATRTLLYLFSSTNECEVFKRWSASSISDLSLSHVSTIFPLTNEPQLSLRLTFVPFKITKNFSSDAKELISAAKDCKSCSFLLEDQNFSDQYLTTPDFAALSQVVYLLSVNIRCYCCYNPLRYLGDLY